MSGGTAESLIAARRRDTTRRRQRVLDALGQLAAAGQEISVSAVARAANVDRSFLYRHHDLRAQVHARAAAPASSPASTAVGKQSLLADLANLREQDQRLRKQNTDLTARLSEVLGEEVFRDSGIGRTDDTEPSVPASASSNSKCSTCVRNSRSKPTTSTPHAQPTATSWHSPTGRGDPTAGNHAPRDTVCVASHLWSVMETVNVVVLSGAPGAGKSSLAEEMFDQLQERDVRHAVIDVDALCLSYPFRAGDPYNSVTAIENVASVWANFSRQGIGRLVLVRVVESRADVERLLAAVPGGRATVCHLAASPSTVEERIRRREAGSSTESLVARGRQLAAMAPDADLVDIVLETDGKALDELATELLAKLGWTD